MNKNGSGSTTYMTLAQDARRILDNFDATPSAEIIPVLEGIRSEMKSGITREYLAGKIDGVREAPTEEDKKGLCKKLWPYLDWQVQGS